MALRPPEEFGLDEVVRFLMTTLRTYDVRHVTPSYMSKLYPEQKTRGLINLEKRKIYLVNNMRNGEHDRVFIHELAHAYKDGIVNADATEDDVCGLANAWLKTIYGLR